MEAFIKHEHYHKVMAVLNNPEFLCLPFDTLYEIISGNTLEITEEKKFESVIRWINHDRFPRELHCRQLMDHITFSLLNSHFLFNKVSQEGLVPRDKRNAIMCEAKGKKHFYVDDEKVFFVLGSNSESNPSIEYFNNQSKEWVEVDTPAPINSDNFMCEEDDNICCAYFSDRIGIYKPSQHQFCYITHNFKHYPRMFVSEGVLHVVRVFPPVYKMMNLMTREKSWTEEWPAPSFRCPTAVKDIDYKIYAIGGQIDDFGPSVPHMEVLHPYASEWERLPDMSQARCRPGVGILNDNIVVVGGSFDSLCCEPFKTSEIYSIEERKWTSGKDMNISRIDPGVAAVGDNLLVVGGDPISGYISVEVYNEEEDEWTLLPNMGAIMGHHLLL